MPHYYHVRISLKNSLPNSDWERFLEQINDVGEAPWDKDSKNTLAVGDYLGFIVGQPSNATVKIFRVDRENTVADRPPWWKSDTPYMEGNGVGPVGHRVVIILRTFGTDSTNGLSWNTCRELTGLGKTCVKWMPRGTQIVKNREGIRTWCNNLDL
tara:strand:- start:173 stop:637 length:465 start_codon:yes stop_codon:yes gene_type:complete